MAIYEIVVTKSASLAKTVAVVRSVSPHSMAAIQKKIEAREPVVSISSDDQPVGMDSIDGARNQHETFMRALASLTSLGDQIEFQYRASADYFVEHVDEAMIKGLMESEMFSRAQTRLRDERA